MTIRDAQKVLQDKGTCSSMQMASILKVDRSMAEMFLDDLVCMGRARQERAPECCGRCRVCDGSHQDGDRYYSSVLKEN